MQQQCFADVNSFGTTKSVSTYPITLGIYIDLWYLSRNCKSKTPHNLFDLGDSHFMELKMNKMDRLLTYLHVYWENFLYVSNNLLLYC